MSTMARPRTFDEHTVLEAARDAFWKTGYAATSMDDLTAATGLGKGSLYAAFGGKRELFDRVFRDYCAAATAHTQAQLKGPDAGAYKRLRAYVLDTAADSAGPQAPRRAAPGKRSWAALDRCRRCGPAPAALPFSFASFTELPLRNTPPVTQARR
jgi:AcrR family transcriptional regulator